MEIDKIESLQKLLSDERILYKYLTLVKGKSNLQPPVKFTKDILNGIIYAISALTYLEFFALYFFYVNRFTEEHICDLLNIDLRELAEATATGKRKLLAKWGYIQYGIDGWLKKKEKDSYSKGYIQGHRAGYQQGKEDCLNPPQFLNDEKLSLPIESLRLSTHARQCLMRYNCKRIGDIADLSEAEIMRTRGMGKGTANEIAHALNQLGIKHTEWDSFLL